MHSPLLTTFWTFIVNWVFYATSSVKLICFSGMPLCVLSLNNTSIPISLSLLTLLLSLSHSHLLSLSISPSFSLSLLALSLSLDLSLSLSLSLMLFSMASSAVGVQLSLLQLLLPDVYYPSWSWSWAPLAHVALIINWNTGRQLHQMMQDTLPSLPWMPQASTLLRSSPSCFHAILSDASCILPLTPRDLDCRVDRLREDEYLSMLLVHPCPSPAGHPPRLCHLVQGYFGPASFYQWYQLRTWISNHIHCFLW